MQPSGKRQTANGKRDRDACRLPDIKRGDFMKRAIVSVVLLFGCGALPAREQHIFILKQAQDNVLLRAVAPSRYAPNVERLNLFRPSSVRAAHDTLYICDSGNNRLRVVDEHLNLITTFGRAGSGPGEMLNPGEIQLYGGVIGVLDSGNHRVNVYGRSGDYRFEFPLPALVRSFAFLDERKIVVPDETGEHAFVVVDSTGHLRRLGQRPPAVPGFQVAYPGARKLMRGIGIDQVAVMDDTVYVADAVTGVIGSYATNGESLFNISPPLPLVRRMFDRFKKIDKGFGGHNVFSALYNEVSPTVDGKLFIVISLADISALIVDPVERTVVVVNPPAHGDGDYARHAGSVARVGTSMVFAAYAGIGFYDFGAR